jgi:hypothetical protein
MAVNKTLGEHTAKELSKRIKKKEDLKKICLDEHMPSLATARKWIKENKYGAFKKRPGTNKGNGGRPTVYSDDLEERIMLRVIDGDSLDTIGKDSDMPSKTAMYLWLANNNGFREQYDRAIDIRDSVMREEILDIVDNSINDFMEKSNKDGTTFMALDPENINRSKMRAEYRFKLMCKTQDKYKDKQTIDFNTKDLTPIYNRVIKKAEKK